MTPPPVSDIVSRLSPTGRKALLDLAVDPQAHMHPAALAALIGRGLVTTYAPRSLTPLGQQVVDYLEAS